LAWRRVARSSTRWESGRSTRTRWKCKSIAPYLAGQSISTQAATIKEIAQYNELAGKKYTRDVEAYRVAFKNLATIRQDLELINGCVN